MRKLAVVIIISLFAGCELVVDVDVPFEHKDLTLNSFFNPDSVWQVQLTLNRHVLDETEFDFVHGAEIVISDENNNVVDVLTKNSSETKPLYIGKTRPQPGKKYSIKASHTGYPQLFSSSRSPLLVESFTARITEKQTSHMSSIAIDVSFRDDPSEKNYYELFVVSEHRIRVYPSTEYRTERSRVYLRTSEPALQDGGVEGYAESYSFVFDDLLLNEQNEFTLEQTYQSFNGQRYIVVLRSLSEDLYKYKLTAQLQEDVAENPFAQPVSVYKNIDNGFGIFAGYTQASFTYEKPVPEIHSFDPSEGKVGDQITIHGKNFNPNRVGVSFTGTEYGREVPAYVTNVTEASVKATVPPGASTGKVIIYSDGTYTVSTIDFRVIQ